MHHVAPDGWYRRVGWSRSRPASRELYETIAPRLRASALLRWCVLALVAFAAVTTPPPLPALAAGWLVLVSLYNALGQYGIHLVTGRAALRLAQGLVVADMAAMVGLTVLYRGLPPAHLSTGFFLVLLEALLWYDRLGVMLSIGLIGPSWATTDLVACLRSARGAFPGWDFLGDLLAVGVVAVALVLVLRVLAATVDVARTEAEANRTAADDAPPIRLSAREKEVLALISSGCSNRMIATRLHLAPSTVKSHVESILARLNARNRAEAVAIAARLQLLVGAVKDDADDGEAAAAAEAGRPPSREPRTWQRA